MTSNGLEHGLDALNCDPGVSEFRNNQHGHGLYDVLCAPVARRTEGNRKSPGTEGRKSISDEMQSVGIYERDSRTRRTYLQTFFIVYQKLRGLFPESTLFSSGCYVLCLSFSSHFRQGFSMLSCPVKMLCSVLIS